MKTLQEQYKLIKEGKGQKSTFLKEAKIKFPNLIRNGSSFEEATSILKSKEVINENFVGLQAINSFETKKDPWSDKFSNFLIEEKEKESKAKAKEKKTTKEVEELETKGYDYKDKKNYDNIYGEEFLNGYYAEMKDPKNSEKTVDELKEIVAKNLSKDALHYVKDGQFGVKELGYTTDHPGLGEPKELKGKYKGSGYGDLKESLSLTSLIMNEGEYYMPEEKKIKEKLEEPKKKAKKSLVADKVKEIENAGNVAALEAKMGAIEEEIENREMKMKMATENEDLAEFINPTRIKEMGKEVKELQKSKSKYLKEYKKLTGEEYKSKTEIVGEDRKAKEYIQSIEDTDEREEERKRMFDNPDEKTEEITEGTPGGVAYMRGQEDFDNGASEDDNPYEKIEDDPFGDYEEWYEGWFRAKMDQELSGI
tara:strand:- start:2889 stop:4157 length:1269 start_codon:yes stop_codon:yes gene_type:complete